MQGTQLPCSLRVSNTTSAALLIALNALSGYSAMLTPTLLSSSRDHKGSSQTR